MSVGGFGAWVGGSVVGRVVRFAHDLVDEEGAGGCRGGGLTGWAVVAAVEGFG